MALSKSDFDPKTVYNSGLLELWEKVQREIKDKEREADEAKSALEDTEFLRIGIVKVDGAKDTATPYMKSTIMAQNIVTSLGKDSGANVRTIAKAIKPLIDRIEGSHNS